ncbi:helix-turn-helix transcriptional regulator [Actinokineospora inagensis]|uniref:helix-turn-helix transcriptional regulator n=1 Tax=Actinokineospora inagensis TaxID=103730 RepID=UPI0003F6340E|nr:response regulator transcription factor [Actinokineospora inagensis]
MTDGVDSPLSISVAMVVRNELHRYGVEKMIAAGGVAGTVYCVPTAAEAVELAGRVRVDVLVVDCAALDDDGTDEILLRAKALGVNVLWLADDALPYERLSLLRCGGCLPVGQLSPESLRDALLRTHRGETVMPSSLVETLVDIAQDRLREPRSWARVRFTPRERQVTGLLVDGLSNKQIARRLRISEHGAKRLVANILAKLDCTNRTLAVSKILREGHIEEYADAAPLDTLVVGR